MPAFFLTVCYQSTQPVHQLAVRARSPDVEPRSNVCLQGKHASSWRKSCILDAMISGRPYKQFGTKVLQVFKQPLMARRA